jgi:hypothetical protein
MRKPFNNHHGLTGNAIAGTYVVFFGLDLTQAQRPGFRSLPPECTRAGGRPRFPRFARASARAGARVNSQ